MRIAENGMGKDSLMRWLCMIVILGVAVSPAVGQDEVKPELLKKMYDDTLAQLKAAQDRKNELATENEKLNAKLTDLSKQLNDANAKNETLQRQVAGYAEQSFYLRSHYTAWQNFLRKYPILMTRWKVFLENDLLNVPNDVPEFIDKDWPLSVEE